MKILGAKAPFAKVYCIYKHYVSILAEKREPLQSVQKATPLIANICPALCLGELAALQFRVLIYRAVFARNWKFYFADLEMHASIIFQRSPEKFASAFFCIPSLRSEKIDCKKKTQPQFLTNHVFGLIIRNARLPGLKFAESDNSIRKPRKGCIFQISSRDFV